MNSLFYDSPVEFSNNLMKARDPNTPLDVLKTLAVNDRSLVRMYVSFNRSSTEEIVLLCKAKDLLQQVLSGFYWNER